MTLIQALGHTIRDAAADNGLTLVQLAKRSGITRSSLYRYLDGERAIPLDTLEDLASTLNMPVSILIARAEEKRRA